MIFFGGCEKDHVHDMSRLQRKVLEHSIWQRKFYNTLDRENANVRATITTVANLF